MGGIATMEAGAITASAARRGAGSFPGQAAESPGLGLSPLSDGTERVEVPCIRCGEMKRVCQGRQAPPILLVVGWVKVSLYTCHKCRYRPGGVSLGMRGS